MSEEQNLGEPGAAEQPRADASALALATLRSAAERATPGPWSYGALHEDFTAVYGVETASGGKPVICDVFVHPRHGWMENAKFIALANPAAVLSLTAQRDQLLEALKRIAAANPVNTNSATPERMASWTKAVAQTAISLATGTATPSTSKEA